MRLTQKDKDFLERLRRLLDEKDLVVDLKADGASRLVLRQNYGTRVESSFGMTRQGVRWRFQRLFNEIYISAYETILFIESQFGTDLREKAMAIARQRWEEHRKARETGQISVPRRQTSQSTADCGHPKLTRDLPSSSLRLEAGRWSVSARQK